MSTANNPNLLTQSKLSKISRADFLADFKIRTNHQYCWTTRTRASGMVSASTLKLNIQQK